MSFAKRKQSLAHTRTYSIPNILNISDHKFSEQSLKPKQLKSQMHCKSVSPYSKANMNKRSASQPKILSKQSSDPRILPGGKIPNKTIASPLKKSSFLGKAQHKLHLYKSRPSLKSMVTPETAADDLKQKSKELERQLQGKLEFSDSDLELYSHVFKKIIKYNKPFSKILENIKDHYTQAIDIAKNESLYQTNIKLEEEKNMLREKKQMLDMQRKALNKKLKKVSKHNVQISRNLQGNEGKYIEIQDKFCALTHADSKQMSKDVNVWRFMLAENKNYAEHYAELKKENKAHKSKQGKLNKLFKNLKKKGFPVDEVYQVDVLKKKNEQVESDTEYLVDEPLKDVGKPKFVPALSLSKLKQNSSSSSSDESAASYEDSEDSY